MKAHLQRIQLLRFAAAAMVLFGHVQLKFSEASGTEVAFEPLGHPAFWASGVDVFFVISGFIIYLTAHDEFGRPDASARFFVRRLARIVPSYWLLTTAMVGSMTWFSPYVSHNQLTAGSVIASYLFIPSVNAYGEPYPVLALGWTLNFEMMFYVLFAIALNWRRKLGLPIVCAALMSLGIVGLIAPPADMPMAFWFNPMVFEFLAGILLARARVSGLRWSTVVGSAVFLLSIVLLYLGSLQSPASPFWSWRALWMGLPAASLCAATVLTVERSGSSTIRRFLALLGDASYALYLTHPFSLALMLMLGQGLGLPISWDWVGTGCVMAVAGALVFHLVLERPAVAWLHHRIQSAEMPVWQRAMEPPR